MPIDSVENPTYEKNPTNNEILTNDESPTNDPITFKTGL